MGNFYKESYANTYATMNVRYALQKLINVLQPNATPEQTTKIVSVGEHVTQHCATSSTPHENECSLSSSMTNMGAKSTFDQDQLSCQNFPTLTTPNNCNNKTSSNHSHSSSDQQQPNNFNNTSSKDRRTMLDFESACNVSNNMTFNEYQRKKVKNNSYSYEICKARESVDSSSYSCTSSRASLNCVRMQKFNHQAKSNTMKEWGAKNVSHPSCFNTLDGLCTSHIPPLLHDQVSSYMQQMTLYFDLKHMVSFGGKNNYPNFRS
jgi:hypothetical protein